MKLLGKMRFMIISSASLSLSHSLSLSLGKPQSPPAYQGLKCL